MGQRVLDGSMNGLEDRVRQRRHPVVDPQPIAARRDESGPAEIGEMP